MPVLPPSTASFASFQYVAPAPGRSLIVLGGVHGNETCGSTALQRIAGDLQQGRLRLATGRLTLVPVANPLAHARGQREGERNLNRALGPVAAPAVFEDHVANWLCPLLAAHELLLDLHSFRAGNAPFVMVGPDDNDGLLEPFAHAALERDWARRLGVHRAVDGWLATYADGTARRRATQALAATGDAPDARHGVGTTEYMRSCGGSALTLECGQHDDPQAVLVAEAAVRHSLAHFGLIDAPAPPVATPMESLRLHAVIDKQHDDDRFDRAWSSFDRVTAGQRLGTRADGSEVLATDDGWIVFPDPHARAGREWFYLAQRSTRF